MKRIAISALIFWIISAVPLHAQLTEAPESNGVDTLRAAPPRTQVALLPGLGSLGRDDAGSITDYSFFILGGRSLENHKLSIAAGWSHTRRFQSGLQLSGLANVGRGQVQGVQVAGLYNRADTLLGFQLGLINTADTVARGLPLGFITYVKKGYHVVELSFDETFRLNAAFQTGVQNLHNIFAFGYGHRNEGLQAWYVGYGLGSAPKLGERVALHVQLISMWLNNADPPTFNLLNRLALGVDYMLGQRISVYGGLQINGMVYETATSFPAYILPQRREPLYREPIGNGYTLHVYPGARVGLRVHW